MHAARLGGQILRDAFGETAEIMYKGEINLVTVTDQASEQAIVEYLHQCFPDHAFLAEEGSGGDTVSTHRWIIDPLDGTTNFAHNYPLFAVSIALEIRGEIVLGVVYNPLVDELFEATLGHGATLNGRRLQVSPTRQLVRCMFATGFPYDVHSAMEENLPYWNRFLAQAQALRRDGSAALDLCYVACGRFDGFWERKLSPWDVAAGSLIVREAGGVVTRYDGSPAGIDDREIVASNGVCHAAMLEVLAQAEVDRSTFHFHRPAVTVDINVFVLEQGDLKVLLIQRGRPPFEGRWALPGGFVEVDESLEQAAARELGEETGVTSGDLHQVTTFGDLERDPRGRTISIAYLSTLPPGVARVQAGDDAQAAAWHPLNDLPSLAFDHETILCASIARLRELLLTGTVARPWLPATFGVPEWQSVAAAVLNGLVSPEDAARHLTFHPAMAPVPGAERRWQWKA